MRDTSARPGEPLESPRGRLIALWIALIVAFSPVLGDLLGVLSQSYSAPILVAPFLLLRCLLSPAAAPSPPRRRALGVGLLLFGLALQFVGLAGGSGSIARLGLPCGVLGLALFGGTPRPTIAALTFWLVPLPAFLIAMTSPELDSALAGIAVRGIEILGVPVSASGPLVRSGDQVLEITAQDGGLPLAFVLSAVGFYSAVLAAAPVAVALRRALLAALLALPCQLVAVVFAVGLTAMGHATAARTWLDYGVWLTAAVVGVLAVEWHQRRNPA